jgi:hypothetical protein
MDNYNDFLKKTIELLLLDETKKIISIEGLNQLKNIKYTDDMKLEMCPIDLDFFNENEEILQLPCRHKFKKKLILKWLTEEQNCCPVCRYEVCGEELDIKKILDLENIILLHITNLNAILN